MSEVLRFPEDTVLIDDYLDHCNVVFTNGCFDIIHPGHIDVIAACIRRASSMGGIVVVGINSDRSVSELKGPDRPIFSHWERGRLLSMIRGVNLVVVYDEPTPETLIRYLKPKVVMKGGDYRPEDVVSAGYPVEIVRFRDGYSTTGIIDRLRSEECASSSTETT